MSNIPSNPYINTPGPTSTTSPGTQVFNHSQQFRQVPSNQLPPGYGGVKQDVNFNSAHETSVVPNSAVGHFNNYSQSASSSPAFNQPGLHSSQAAQLSPQKFPLKPTSQSTIVNQYESSAPLNYASSTISTVSSANPYPPNFPPQQKRVNNNASSLISSQQNRPLFNGPPIPRQDQVQNKPPINTLQPSGGQINPLQQVIPSSLPYSAGLSAPLRNSPLLPGPPLSIQSANGLSSNIPLGSQLGVNGSSNTRHLTNPPLSGMQYAAYNGPTDSGKSIIPTSGLPNMSGPQSLSSGPPLGPQSIPSLGPQKASNIPYTLPTNMPTPCNMPTPSSMTLASSSGPPGFSNTPVGIQNASSLPLGPSNIPSGPPSMPLHPSRMGPLSQSGHSIHPNMPSDSTSLPSGPPMQSPSVPNMPIQVGVQSSNLQNRYPQMPSSSYANYQSQPQKGTGRYYPQQPNPHELTKQMGQLSVTKQGFDQLWGHEMVDLLQCRNVLPEYPEDPPEIRLTHQFADSPNCSPEIFRCTINRIPETNSLLQKSRLPLGILIHPFKDLNHLPVIQCNTIVRCRACRTYINPFVYFVDSKRWKCNLCYRVNDLPEEFQYDPVSKSYGDPSRRPEIKSATIEFIAPGEYMLRPPQPAVYLFLLDVSHIARDSGYLQVFCETLKNNLEQLPGDARTQVGFICYDSHVHYYLMSDGLTRPKEMTVLDIDDVFLPSPEALLVNMGERREMVQELLTILPQRYSTPGVPSSALGAALQAAYKLMAPTGGRITVFQTCLPNIGPGALQSREDPNARSSKDVNHLNPATDFYKRMALDCSGAQISVDLFLLSSQYSDLASLSGMSKFSAGTVYHIPIFRANRSWQADQFRRMFTRYLTRKIGFEAVMRVRCTRGIAIHTFHGNFFVRSTDLLSLPNVSPDAGFGMQLSIEESLTDLQHVCFQAALLYTSSKGERRIRVHTMALPIASTLPDVLHAADQQCIIGLLSKMAVDRAASASMSEAREALTNVAIDAMSAHRLARNLPAGASSNMLNAPMSLRLLPLYLSALLKRKAFRTGTSTRLDERVADMGDLKTQPLSQLLRGVYPDLYPIHTLKEYLPRAEEEDDVPDPPRMHLTAERINLNGAYLLDDGETMTIYVCQGVSPAFLSEIFGVTAFSQLPDEARSLPQLQTEGNALLHAFIEKLNDDRPYPSNILILRDNSPSRQLFTERLVDDRVESAFSYYEFLQHVKDQVK